MDKPAWTDDAIAERLQNLFAEEQLETSDTQWAYREAAAVRVYFEFDELQPLGAIEEGADAASVIGGDSELAFDEENELRWTLRPEVRRQTLKRLQEQGRLRDALAGGFARDGSLLQDTFRSYLRGTATPVASQKLEELRATTRVVDLLKGVVDDLPDEQALAHLVERETLLAPLRTLVGDHFAGRTNELTAMTDYVAALRPSGIAERFIRAFEAAFSMSERPALCVYGPGGIGKSTLVAKFILDHTDVAEAERIPFAYLDFDRPGLIAEEPITLLFEALRQLEAQYPAAKAQAEALRGAWAKRLADTAGRSERSAEGWRGLRLKDRDYYVDSFSAFVKTLGQASQPVLFVLDTLEEVQLRNQSLVAELLSFIASLQNKTPRLRCVLSGRVAAESTLMPIWPLELSVFDRPSARAFLQFKLRSLTPEVADVIAGQIGGSPLTLKLAVTLLEQDPEAAGPGGISGVGGWLATIKRESIQSQLYTRILGHIKNDEEVKKLAHPGLILRRITPDVIQRVLAEPCGVSVPDLAAATGLMTRLKRQVVLVVETAPDVLVHRPDLRKVMLAPLRESDKKKTIEEIEQRAIAYYFPFDDPDSRAEEIYHRLALGQRRADVNPRWMEGLKKPLQNALEELPPAAQAFLAAKLELEIAPELWAQADQEDWETYAVRRAREHLKYNRPDDAQATIFERARNTWTAGSPLYSIEIDVLTQLGRINEAFAANSAAQQTSERFDEATRSRLEHQRVVLQPTPRAQAPRLGSSRLRALREAMLDAVPQRAELETMLHDELGRNLWDIASPGGSLEDTVFVLLKTAEAQGWTGELVLAARNAYPGNKKLFAIAQELGLSASSGGQIDAFLTETSKVDPEEFRRRLTIVEACVCRIEVHAKTMAASTGFLIEPDTVLTAHRNVAAVVEGSLPGSALSVRFDYRGTRGEATTSGKAFDVRSIERRAARNEDATDDQLDFVLLRLAGSPGRDPGTRGTTRGWLDLKLSAPIAPESAIAVVYSESDGSLKLALDVHGVAAVNPRGRITLKPTLPSVAWGAPCFNEQLILSALIVGQAPERLWRSTGTEAVPIDRIARAIAEHTGGTDTR